jgi:hypothetical protein
MLKVSLTIAAIAVACAGAAGCAPGTLPLDNPKTGDTAQVAPGQGLLIRWSDPSETRDWVLVEPLNGALKSVTQSTAPGAAGGAMKLEHFEFVGAKPGEERLTFAYRTKNGAPDPADETATLVVKVG